MQFNEIRRIAKGWEINTYRMKKIDIIRNIQKAEKNMVCYGTSRVGYCNEEGCLWRSDCMACSEIEE